MTRSSLLVLLASTLLAGCGHAPGLAPVRAGALPAALVDTSRHRKTLVVPESVMGFADDYMGRMHAKYDKGDQSVHLGLTLRASADRFEHVFEATLGANNPRQGKGPQTFMLEEDAPSGELTYYMVVRGSVVSSGPDKLSVDALPDFYVSDYGRNFTAIAR